MDQRNTLTSLVEELGRLIAPLKDALTSPENFAAFMRELGWDTKIIPLSLQQLVPLLDIIEQQVDEIASNNSNIQDLFGSLKSIFSSINNLKNQAPDQLPLSIDINEFKADFPGQLVSFLVVEYLENENPRIFFFLKTIGVIRESLVNATGLRPAYKRKELIWNDITHLLSDPFIFMKNAYFWGQSRFDVELLTLNLAGLLSTLELEFQLERPQPALFNFLTKGNIGLQPHHNWILSVPLIQDKISSVKTELGFALYYLPETASTKPGFALAPYARGNVSTELDLTETLKFIFNSEVDISGGIAVTVRPGQDVEVIFDIVSSGGTGKPLPKGGKFSVSIINQNKEGAPILLLGSENASRLEYLSASLKTGVQLTSGAETDLFAEVDLNDVKLVIQPSSDADSFLAKMLPRDGFTVELSLGIGLSSKQGFYFRGSGGIEILLPAHIQLGIIEVQSAFIALKPNDQGIPIELGGTIRGDLGALKAVIENIGLRANFTFPSSGGNLGPADLSLSFKPPDGVGLTIDAGAVKGGGYLHFNPDEGEYSGALELVVSDFLSLKAIGLINTKLPGGQSGFSLLVIITAEFDPGFQLGFGFILVGVGGLVGLNRSMLLDPLVQGVRTGAVNSILFPTDVVANAPKILSDLQAIFPIHEGTFLIGPMAKINWGSPPLISIMLGVIIEIPGNVVILGNLKAALPTAEDPVLVIQVTFVGALEFDKRRFWFFAKLYESQVLSISIEGEMGLLMDYSDNPNFILSIGGFHPRFKVPALPFPLPSRITLSIINESWAKLRAETYFAITSNTVQMGCRAESFFGFDDFSVEGYINFDALLRFSPFYLIADISSSYSVKVFGVGAYSVHLKGSLEGPTPWRVRGSASIDFFITSFSVDVDVTFGERRAETLPPIEVLPRLKEEFEKIENWRTKLPDSSRLHVSLRKLGDADALVLHPVGILEISQRFVPLNLPLDKIGNQKPSDIKKATITVLTSALAVKGPAKELFAVAQYRDMDDAAKLSAQSYEPMECGIKLGVAVQPWATGPLAQRHVRYEQVVMDSAFERVPTHHVEYPQRLFAHFCGGAAVTRSPLSQANQKRRQPFAEKVVVSDEQFVVASQMNNRIYQKDAAFSSYAEAQSYMQELIRNDPSIMDEIHVIPSVEVNASKVKTP